MEKEYHGADKHETLSAGGKGEMSGPERHIEMRVASKDTEKMAERRSASRCTAVDDHKGEDINDLADAFIKNFRNQLRIQREESFKRFRDMLARGT
uniref:Uncharacterized protein n=1 Tax=Kalanchoe fedtschenkoi TaxID=63787 RepID=A0A7N0UFA8_KALFE